MRRSWRAQAGAVSAIAVALLAVPGAASAAALTTPNLIENPGAEAQPGSGDGSTVPVPFWTVPAGGTFTAVKYGASGGFPTASAPGPKKRGANFFAGGPGSDAARADQTVPLSAYATIIAHGATYKLGAWLGGFASQDDNTTVTIAWEKANGTLLGAVMIGPVSAAARQDVTGMLYRAKAGTIPHGTAKAVVNVEMTRAAGSYNDGYADNLSLTLASKS